MLIVEQAGLPIVGVNVSTNVGAETSGTPGLGSLTAAMLMRGTATRDAIKRKPQLPLRRTATNATPIVRFVGRNDPEPCRAALPMLPMRWPQSPGR